MKILWIDDVRRPPQGGNITWAANFDTAVSLLRQNYYDLIDFDHDLGVGLSGYDIAKWLVENEYPPTTFHVHSMNPVGRANIIQLLTHYGYTLE